MDDPLPLTSDPERSLTPWRAHSLPIMSVALTAGFSCTETDLVKGKSLTARTCDLKKSHYEQPLSVSASFYEDQPKNAPTGTRNANFVVSV